MTNDNVLNSARTSNLFAVRGKVTNIVMHERSAINVRTGLTKLGSARSWREIEVEQDDSHTFSTIGDVIHGVNVGDRIALVFPPHGRAPLTMVNITQGTYFVHRSVDPSASEGKGVWAIAGLIALVGAIPGVLAFMTLFFTVFPTWTENNLGQVLKLFPFVLIPASIYAAVRLEGRAVARAKRVYGEIVEALFAVGITIHAEPPPHRRGE